MIRTEIFVTWSPFRGAFECVAFHNPPGGKQGVGVPLTFETQEDDGGYISAPTFTLSPEEAQVLADQLWNAGVHPSGSKQGAGAFEAQGRHLEDMRSLVFKTQHK